MSEGTKAVFLSYASQDAEAAKRICDALRAAGVEVWFDQSELVGGDAWDQKIRRQIKECALLIPIISAATQARTEGYFRLEWRLADQRTHTMAKGRPFILPVVIDDTRDADAHVPDSFTEVQWTRLQGGEGGAAFAQRVQRLLAGSVAGVADPGSTVGASLDDARGLRSKASERDGRRPAAPLQKLRKPWLVPAILAALAIAGLAIWPPGQKPQTPPAPAPYVAELSIAVLPFTNMSDDKDNAYFADGVHEDVLTYLANLRALKVISRNSMLQYRETKKLTGQIGRELGVTYVLEGSVRRVGNTVRVTGQLIKAATDEHVWAKTYDRDLRDIFAVQAELAHEITAALHAVLSPAEAAGLEARPTNSIEAYDSFQKARMLARSVPNASDVQKKIIPLLERAVALDPDYAAAWTDLSMQHAALYVSVDHTEARLAQVKSALAQAERLAPEAYPVLIAGSKFGALTGNSDMVKARRQRIDELYSHRAESHLLRALDARNEARWGDAQAGFRAALRLDPRNPEVLSSYFIMLDSMRRWDEAEVVAATLAEVQPDNLDIRLLAASMVFRRSGSTGQLTRLLAELPRNLETRSDIVVRNRIAFLTADWPGLVAIWRESGPRFKTGSFSDRADRFMVATAFLKLGDRTSASPLLQQIRDEILQQLRDDPENIAARTELGVALGMLDDRTGARAALDRTGELIAARHLQPPRGFTARWDYAVARSWVDEKDAVIPEISRLLREPSPRSHLANVHILRVRWESMLLHGEPKFEAMLNDPANNGPLF